MTDTKELIARLRDGQPPRSMVIDTLLEEAADTLESLTQQLAERDAEVERLKALSVTHIMLDVIPGDGSGFEVYAKSVDDVVNKLTDLDNQLEAALERNRGLRAQLAAAQQAQPERAALTVDVFYLDGHDPFICGVHGKLTVAALSEIERDIQANPDFKKGDGVYSYTITRFEGQYGFEGRCELAPCWELVAHEFTPVDAAINAKAKP